MTARLLWLTLAVFLIAGIAIAIYRSKINSLPIDPHAAEEIEKAKRR